MSINSVKVYENIDDVKTVIGTVNYNSCLDVKVGEDWYSGEPGCHRGIAQLEDGRWVIIQDNRWQGSGAQDFDSEEVENEWQDGAQDFDSEEVENEWQDCQEYFDKNVRGYLVSNEVALNEILTAGQEKLLLENDYRSLKRLQNELLAKKLKKQD